MFPRKLSIQCRRSVSPIATLLATLALAGVVQLVAAPPAGAFIASGWEAEWGEGSEGGGWGAEGGGEGGSWEDELPSPAEEEEKRLSDEENEAIEAFEERVGQERAEREEKELSDREARAVEEKVRRDEEEPERVFEEERRRVEGMPAVCERLFEEGMEAAVAGNEKLSSLRLVESASCETILAIELSRFGLPAPPGATPVGPGQGPPPAPAAAPGSPAGGYGPTPRLKGSPISPVGPLNAPRSVSQAETARAIAPSTVHGRHRRHGRRLSPSPRH